MNPGLRYLAAVTGCVVALPAASARAQQPVTREQAVASAQARGARAGLARADSAAARAEGMIARAFGNPTLLASYSKSAPQLHAIMEVPLGYPWIRSARVGAAAAAERSANYRSAFERAAVRFDAETAYDRALAAAAHERLTRRTADAADSLLRMARVRRDAGDASDLDVELAVVNAGQLAGAATDDSVASVEALLDLQLTMGLPGDTARIAMADSLSLAPPDAPPPLALPTLRVASATAAFEATDAAVSYQHRNVFAAPALEFGFETRDPSGGEPGLLPTIGFAIPIPLFNFNGGPIAAAEAARERARTERDVAQRESDADVARARRLVAVTRGKAERSRALVASAERVAAMSLRAYAEGAIALPAVLEAQRNARELLAQHVDDLAAAGAAASTLRLVTAAAQP
jgi:outer membrane protein, heavy metal efflux system